MTGYRASLLIATLTALGCEGTETGNPFDGEMRADAHSSDPGQVAVGTGGAVEVTEVWLSVDPAEMVPTADCDDAASAFAIAPDYGTADHGVPGSTLAAFELPADDYCRMLLPFLPARAPLPAGAPAELEGASVVIRGRLVDPEVPFLLVAPIDRDVDLRGVDGHFALGPDSPALFLGFDVATWFDGVDLANADLDVGGTAIIDAVTNTDLLSAFEDNFDRGIELYRDADRDGAVSLPDDELLATGQL